MLRLLCAAQLLRAGSGLRRALGPNDEEYQDYLDDFWEQSQHNFSLEPRIKVRERSHTNESWCKRSRFAVPSQEDSIAGATSCKDNHTLHVREFLGSHCMNHYGQLLSTCDAPGCLFYWVEIPSTGSSSMKSMLYPYFKKDSPQFGAVREEDVRGVRAFAFLRHPVARFVGAYGNIMAYLTKVRFVGAYGNFMAYLTKVPPDSAGCLTEEFRRLLEVGEPERFGRFVDLFIARGPGIVEMYPCPENPCLLFGLMSQTWFLNLWPGPIDFLGHVESADLDIGELGNLMNVSLTKPMRKRRKMSSSSSLSLGSFLLERTRIQRLHDYFRHDMAQHGYSPLPGFV